MTYSVKELCQFLNGSRSGYYNWEKRQKITTEKDLADQKLAATILEIYKKRKIFGYRRITQKLRKDCSMIINAKRVIRLMRKLGIRSIIRRKRYPNLSLDRTIKRANLLNREFRSVRPRQKLVTDITYLFVGTQRYYLSVILDLFNNQVVSYRLSSSPDLSLVLGSLDDWVLQEQTVRGAILHSDQGGTYTSPLYTKSS